MRKLTSFISLFLLGVVAFAQDSGAASILDKVAKNYEGLSSFTAKLTYNLEVTSNPDLNEKMTFDFKSKGSKFYAKQSDGEEFYCNGTYIWNIFDGEGTKTDYDTEDSPMPVDLDEVLSSYKENYKYVLKQNETVGGIECNVIDLEPKKSAEDMATSDVFKIRLLIDPKTYDVKQFIVFERNGNRHKFRFDSFKKNIALSDSIFTFDEASHPDVIVEDLTED